MASRNIVLLTLSFLLIFMGFDTAQQYFSSIFYTENIQLISFISLSLIYLTFSLSTFFTPFFCRKLGLKKSLFFSSLVYPIFILSVISQYEFFIYLSSIITGFGASLIWTAHGTYLTKSTNEKNRGFYSGLFFSFLVLGTSLMVFGMSFFVENFSYGFIYFFLFLVAIIGSILLLFLPKIENLENYKLYPSQIIKKEAMLLLIPFIFASSFVFGLMISIIPIRITDLFGLSYVGKISSIFIFSLMLVSFVVGKLSDRYGVKKFVYLSLIFSFLGFFLILSSKGVVLFSLGIFLLAFNYASLLSLSYPIISKLFSKDLDSGMAIRWMVFGFAIFISTIFSTIFGFFELIIMGIAFVILALIFTRELFYRYNF